jgi:hypothetical protein
MTLREGYCHRERRRWNREGLMIRHEAKRSFYHIRIKRLLRAIVGIYLFEFYGCARRDNEVRTHRERRRRNE